jgi:ABC-type multidrug transport system fused ATPase/permease subunit
MAPSKRVLNVDHHFGNSGPTRQKNVRQKNGASSATLAITALGAAASYTESYLTTRVGQWIMHDLRQELYHHIQGLSLSYYDRHKTGDLIGRILSGLRHLCRHSSSNHLRSPNTPRENSGTKNKRKEKEIKLKNRLTLTALILIGATLPLIAAHTKSSKPEPKNAAWG